MSIPCGTRRRLSAIEERVKTVEAAQKARVTAEWLQSKQRDALSEEETRRATREQLGLGPWLIIIGAILQTIAAAQAMVDSITAAL